MEKYQRNLLRTCIWLILCCLPVSAFGADKVTLQLIWKNQFQFAGYYVAKELGFYDEAGLDVTIKEYEFGTDVTADVVSLKTDFGVGRSSLILESMEGKPVFLLAAIFQQSPFMLLAKKRKDLKEVADLKGKRIMVTDDVVGMASLTAMLTSNGINPDAYTSQKHTFTIDDLISGNTDAIAAYTSNEPFQMQKRGVDYTIFAPKDHGFDFYSDILFTSQKLYQDNPQLVERFNQASLRGWEYAFGHIDEAVEIILKKFNTQNRDQDALRFEADTLKTLAYDRDTALGLITKGRLEQIAQVYRLLGFTIKPLKTDDLFYDQETRARLYLTPEEKSWLAAHRKIVVGGETDWAPFDFVDETGNYAGIANNYLKIIEETLGIEVEMITGPSWDELLSMMRRKEIDVLPAIYHSEERETFVHFTTPYIKITEFIFSRSDNQSISSFADLKGKTTIVVKGYTIEGYLRSNYPDYELITAPTIQDALKKLITGEADAFIGDIISTSFNLKELSLVGIKPIAPVSTEGPTVHMAVRKDWPVLRNLIDKTLKAIPDGEHDAIKTQWISFAEKKIEKSLPKVSLTAEEQNWVKQHPVIRVHNETDWPPFNFFANGLPQGFSIDYMDLVAEQMGIKVEYVTGPSWNEFLGMVKRKELDVMLNIVKTEDRMKYLLYTEPYIKNPNVIVSSKESPYETIEALFGMTVAFPKGFFYEEVLTKSFPRIKRLPVVDTLASLKAVTFGRADAALGEAAVVRTLINKNLLTGLRISGEVNIGNPDLTNLRLGVRDDWPLLQSALMKAMAAITPQKMNQIRQKWLVVDVPTTTQETAVLISYGRLIAYGIAVFLSLSLLAWILVKTIKKEQIAVHFGSRWFRGIVLAGLSVFVMIICLLGWFTLERIREKILAGVGQDLTETLTIAKDRLDLWVTQRTYFLKLLARDPDLVRMTQRLLAVPPNRDDLLASTALRDVRSFFTSNTDIISNIGFFIINADYISIGSQRDTNIGTRNLIALQRPDLLERAFAGDVLFVPPIESDLPLAQGSEADGVRNPSTKFFMGPIRDTNRQIIAVMTLRVNPSEDLTQLLSSSKTRKTGETYTFSEHGELLSGSRFDEQLRRIGLIEDDQRSALNVAIRDPGVNLVAGRRAEIERSQQPLTRMASRAFQLKLDMENAGQSHGHSKIEIDTSGYRDYRGVPVFGAWLWDADVGLGLASEIDVAEAMSDYYQIRWTVFGVLAVTLLLSVGATMLVLLIGERTSQALRKSRDELELRVQQRTAELRKLSQATENSPASVVVTDKDGIIEYVNPIFCEVTGYSADEAIGQNPRVLKSGDLPESYYKELWDTILSGNVWRGEFVNKKKNGEEFWESASISPIKSEEGEVTHFVAVKEDITSRKQMENDLQERVKELGEAQSVMLKMMSDLDEEKQKVEKTNEVLAAEIIEKKKAEKLLIERENDFLKLVDNMPGSFWRVEHAPEWPVVYFSQGTKELSGYSAEEFMEGKVKWIERTHPEDLDRLVEVIGDAVERKEVFDITYRFIRADGQIRWVREIGIYFDRGGGNVPFLDGFVLDVHEQKLSEEELKKAKVKADEATRAKGDFLANMSHEIRTPMNAVIGMSHLALKTELTPKQKDYLNKIQSSANSLLGIINDILDFSKIEAGKLDMESVEFNLDDVLDNLANLVTVKAQEKEDLEVLFATGSEVPRFLVGDPLRLGQVLINLANNAVKFTDSGEIVVSTELLKQDEAGLALKFSVRDTGIGLTEEQIGKLFQSFSQADTSTTRKFGGTGLGLTISKRLVEMMGGDIGVESESGQGTTFSFTANLGLGKETVKKRLVPSSDLRGMKVLVVDDSATSRNILQDILESFTFDVTLAASAEEGLEEIQRADTDQPYEMVLMDWKMPGLDGLEASEQIKNQQNLSKIPAIILVTAYGREELMQRAEQIGLEGFLIKPIGPSVLFDTIMHAFGEAVPETSRLAQKPEHDAEAFERIRGANVLLVEDNEINQQVAMEILQGAGLNVTVANDGQQGVDAAMRNQYDAILMDIQMPVMDGYEATRKIREWEFGMRNAEKRIRNSEFGSRKADDRGQKTEDRGQRTENRNQKADVRRQMTDDGTQASNLQPPTSNIPIIAMTAHAMTGDDKKSIEAGMNGHVTKPIDPDQLFSTLQKWVKPSEKRDQVQQPEVPVEQSESDKTVPAEGELPEYLPGFDLADGLKRLQENKRLYRKLLLSFATDYNTVANEIRQALDAADFNQVHSLVHNLKGLAGNLAATELQAAAMSMEKFVKGVDKKAPPSEQLNLRLSELENTLNQALESAQSLGVSAEENHGKLSAEEIVDIPTELSQDIAKRIRNAAEIGDVMTLNAIAAEIKTQSESCVPLSKQIVQMAEDFDLDGIQKLADDLDAY